MKTVRLLLVLLAMRTTCRSPRSARASHWRLLRMAALAALIVPAGALAQDAVRGAMLYLRLDNDTRSCVSCHGPDPGQSHNNILRAADSPDTLTKVLNTVSAMGFLRSQLSDQDRVDIAAYLGSIVDMNQSGSKLLLWPPTLEFGRVAPGQPSGLQFVRVENISTTAVALQGIQVSDAQFQAASDCPSRLAPGSACAIEVRMAPQGVGLVRGAVSVGSPDLARVRIVGGSALSITGPLSALRWQDAPRLVRFEPGADPASLSRSLTLENPGPMPVVLSTSSIVGPQASQFRIEGGCAAGQVLPAGTSCSMRIGFTPSAAVAQAALQVRGDNANPDAVRLEGLATQSAQPEPAAAESGGGCSVGPPSQRERWDPVLMLAVLLAMQALRRRHRR